MASFVDIAAEIGDVSTLLVNPAMTDATKKSIGYELVRQDQGDACL